MKRSNVKIIGITKLGLLLLLTVAMTACAGGAGLNNSTSSWKEEVLLHDGNTVIVTRTLKRGGRHEIGQGWPIKEQSLSFTIPNTKQSVVWQDSYSQDVGGANFLPMMLEIKDNVPYLVVNPMGLLPYNKWGRPNPPYIIFRYQDNDWQRVSLDELPIEFKQFNLIFSTPDENAKKLAVNGVVPAQKIRAYYDGRSDPRKEFKSLIREPVAVGDVHLVPYGNGGWLGIDWFSDQPNYKSCALFCEKKKVAPKDCPCNELFKGK